MIDPAHQHPKSLWRSRLLFMAIAALVYLAVPMLQTHSARPAGHFPRLARALLHGRLSIDAADGRTDELIPTQQPGRFYCPYPPLPAILLIPAVLLGGIVIKVEWICRLVSVINVGLFDACLDRLPQRMGLEALNHSARTLMTLLFAFGTATWPNAWMGGDWHLAHAVAMAAFLLAIHEYSRSNRPKLIGMFIGLAILARPTMAMSGLFFALPLMNRDRLAGLTRFAIGPVAAVILLGIYNMARFGSPLNFGYDRMILHGLGRRLMETYGQFHQVYIPRNFFWFFLAPPWLRSDGAFPWIGFDPRGMSLLLATPALFYVFVAIRREWSRREARHAALASAACLLPLLLYFNTGYWQFGHRFSMDYLPLLMILVLAGMGARPSRTAYGLIVLSIGIHAWGVALDSITTLPGWLVPMIT